MKFLKNFLIMKKLAFIFLIVMTLTATVAQAETGTVNTGTIYQTLEGFGAANVWSGSTLVTLAASYPEIYDIIFGDLGLDIVRLRNTYAYPDLGYDYMANCQTAITNGRARTGRPLKIMISSWSPKASLKSNASINGGSEATLAQSSGAYVYSDFATWWADSVAQYISQGMTPDYISIQNEPDWDTSSYESCRFEPSQTSTVAGYDQAFEAVYSALYSRMGSSMPKMLAPETTGLQGAKGSAPGVYISKLNLSHVYGYAHHLYNCSDGGNAGCASNPDNYITNMSSFGSSYGNKPIIQTEYSDGSYVTSYDSCIYLATLMHNALTVEGAAGYIYWELAYGTGLGLVSITTSSWTINPIYYAMLHYSKYTDPGWRRVAASTDSGNLRISAFLSADSKEMSIVIINTAYSSITLSLSSGSFSASSSAVYQTTESSKVANIGAFTGSLTLPQRSITTVNLTSGGSQVTIAPTTQPNDTPAPTTPPTETAVPTATPAPTTVPTATPAGVTTDPTTPPGETIAPTNPPTVTDTPPVGCTCANLCSSQTSLSVPFTKDGAGEFCYTSSSLGSYVNSWNADAVNINGTSCTNTYVSSSSIAAISGLYYIYYKASYSWSHMEIK